MRPRLLDLPHGYQTVIDEDDWPLVADLTLYRGGNGYVYYSRWDSERARSDPRTLHGLLMRPPKGTHVDHINGDKLDNRRTNLRVVSPSVNQINRKRPNKNNRSGARGVHLNSHGSWVAQITADRRHHYLGSFSTLEDAVRARRAAELEYFGEVCP